MQSPFNNANCWNRTMILVITCKAICKYIHVYVCQSYPLLTNYVHTCTETNLGFAVGFLEVSEKLTATSANGLRGVEAIFQEFVIIKQQRGFCFILFPTAGMRPHGHVRHRLFSTVFDAESIATVRASKIQRNDKPQSRLHFVCCN